MNRIYALVGSQALDGWSLTDEGACRQRRSGTRKGLVVLAAGLLGMGGLPAVFALPSGEKIVSGSADILVFDDGKQMAINQRTDKLITTWNDFSVSNDQTVSFNQLSKTSVALNRVIGTHGSDIQGRINANGQVFLINPSGVVFGSDAQVNVGGLVASTQNISDDNFTAGNYRFAGTSEATIVNSGTITAADGGSVALLGKTVSNKGSIKAQQGHIALGAGNDFTVSFDSNQLLDLQVDAAAIDALVSNGGVLKADGGQVLMTAKSAGSMQQAVVNNRGTIEANTLSRKAGRIILDGGDVGVVDVGGSLSASALMAVGDGGEIETRGAITQVQLAAQVDTQASNGQAGTWKISSSEVIVNPTATPGQNTLHVDTLAHNLATTHVELSSKTGDIAIGGAVAWNSGNQLSLASARDIHLNVDLKGSGSGTRIELKAAGDTRLNRTVELAGANSSLGLNYQGAYTLSQDGRVLLSGTGARLDANGQAYNVIQNTLQLQAIGDSLSGFYVLGNDIKGSGTIKSIGGNRQFTGVFDGWGNTISGFTVSADGPYGGLFASSSGAISNLKLASMNINGADSFAGFSYLGGLVGLNLGEITNVSATGMRVYAYVSPSNTVGGLVGVNKGGTLDRASVAGSVLGNNATTVIGGLIGENNGGTVKNSTTSVQVSGPMPASATGGIGGLVGVNQDGTITGSSSAGAVGLAQSHSYVGVNLGGLVGYNLRGAVDDSHSTASVAVYANSHVGGLIGINSFGKVTDSSASGTVFGYSSAAAGGLVGLNQQSTLTNVKAVGTVSDSLGRSVGGLVGKSLQSQISGAEATGNVVGGNSGEIGGLIGHNFAGLTEHSVARGKVTGGTQSSVGGLVGYNDGDLNTVEASGNVTGGVSSHVGGLVGDNGSLVDHHINIALASGDVLGTTRSTVGGLVGKSDSQIAHAMAKGQVSGGANARLGGLAGLNMDEIRDSTASGKILATQPNTQVFGGLVGINFGSMRDNRASGQATHVPLAGSNYGEMNGNTGL